MTPIEATRVPIETPKPPMYSHEHRQQFIASMLAELAHAYAKHGARPWSRHEFYAVMKEEVDELWDAVKQDGPIEEVLKEAMQIACVCLRYAETPDAYRGTHPLPLPCRIDMEKALGLLPADPQPAAHPAPGDWRQACHVEQAKDGYWDVWSHDKEHYVGVNNDDEYVWRRMESPDLGIGIFASEESARAALSIAPVPPGVSQ